MVFNLQSVIAWGSSTIKCALLKSTGSTKIIAVFVCAVSKVGWQQVNDDKVIDRINILLMFFWQKSLFEIWQRHQTHLWAIFVH